MSNYYSQYITNTIDEQQQSCVLTSVNGDNIYKISLDIPNNTNNNYLFYKQDYLIINVNPNNYKNDVCTIKRIDTNSYYKYSFGKLVNDIYTPYLTLNPVSQSFSISLESFFLLGSGIHNFILKSENFGCSDPTLYSGTGTLISLKVLVTNHSTDILYAICSKMSFNNTTLNEISINSYDFTSYYEFTLTVTDSKNTGILVKNNYIIVNYNQTLSSLSPISSDSIKFTLKKITHHDNREYLFILGCITETTFINISMVNFDNLSNLFVLNNQLFTNGKYKFVILKIFAKDYISDTNTFYNIHSLNVISEFTVNIINKNTKYSVGYITDVAPQDTFDVVIKSSEIEDISNLSTTSFILKSMSKTSSSSYVRFFGSYVHINSQNISEDIEFTKINGGIEEYTYSLFAYPNQSSLSLQSQDPIPLNEISDGIYTVVIKSSYMGVSDGNVYKDTGIIGEFKCVKTSYSTKNSYSFGYKTILNKLTDTSFIIETQNEIENTIYSFLIEHIQHNATNQLKIMNQTIFGNTNNSETGDVFTVTRQITNTDYTYQFGFVNDQFGFIPILSLDTNTITQSCNIFGILQSINKQCKLVIKASSHGNINNILYPGTGYISESDFIYTTNPFDVFGCFGYNINLILKSDDPFKLCVSSENVVSQIKYLFDLKIYSGNSLTDIRNNVINNQHIFHCQTENGIIFSLKPVFRQKADYTFGYIKMTTGEFVNIMTLSQDETVTNSNLIHLQNNQIYHFAILENNTTYVAEWISLMKPIDNTGSLSPNFISSIEQITENYIHCISTNQFETTMFSLKMINNQENNQENNSSYLFADTATIYLNIENTDNTENYLEINPVLILNEVSYQLGIYENDTFVYITDITTTTSIKSSEIVGTYLTKQTKLVIKKINGKEETYICEYDFFKTTNSFRPTYLFTHTSELVETTKNSVQLISTNSENITYSFEITIPCNEHYNQIKVKDNKLCINIDELFRTEDGCIVTKICGPDNCVYELGHIQNDEFISLLCLNNQSSLQNTITYDTFSSIFNLDVGVYNSVIRKKNTLKTEYIAEFNLVRSSLSNQNVFAMDYNTTVYVSLNKNEIYIDSLDNNNQKNYKFTFRLFDNSISDYMMSYDGELIMNLLGETCPTLQLISETGETCELGIINELNQYITLVNSTVNKTLEKSTINKLNVGTQHTFVIKINDFYVAEFFGKRTSNPNKYAMGYETKLLNSNDDKKQCVMICSSLNNFFSEFKMEVNSNENANYIRTVDNKLFVNVNPFVNSEDDQISFVRTDAFMGDECEIGYINENGDFIVLFHLEKNKDCSQYAMSELNKLMVSEYLFVIRTLNGESYNYVSEFKCVKTSNSFFTLYTNGITTNVLKKSNESLIVNSINSYKTGYSFSMTVKSNSYGNFISINDGQIRLIINEHYSEKSSLEITRINTRKDNKYIFGYMSPLNNVFVEIAVLDENVKSVSVSLLSLLKYVGDYMFIVKEISQTSQNIVEFPIMRVNTNTLFSHGYVTSLTQNGNDVNVISTDGITTYSFTIHISPNTNYNFLYVNCETLCMNINVSTTAKDTVYFGCDDKEHTNSYSFYMTDGNLNFHDIGSHIQTSSSSSVVPINNMNLNVGNYTAVITSGQNYVAEFPVVFTATCFLKGTRILCLVDEQEIYIPIETLRKGMYVKTHDRGYKQIDKVGYTKLRNSYGNSMNKLYKMTCKKNPELVDDLYVTGGHPVLVDELTLDQINRTTELWGNLRKVGNKYRLLAFLSDKFEPVEDANVYELYDVVLQNEIYQMDMNGSEYGIYANGVLTESMNKEIFDKMSGMTHIE